MLLTNLLLSCWLPSPLLSRAASSMPNPTACARGHGAAAERAGRADNYIWLAGVGSSPRPQYFSLTQPGKGQAALVIGVGHRRNSQPGGYLVPQ
jgi:hypothetical protein